MSPERKTVRAERGTDLRCRGWRQEGLLRMLENTIENGEDPENLVIYGSLGKAARNWDSYERTREVLLDLKPEETLVIQSGKPIGVFSTSPSSPLVLMATSNLVGRWAREDHFYELEDRDQIMWGGYTAGDWQYIGSQGIIQGTYQTFAEVAAQHFGGTLEGRLVVTAGLGGMGGAQPLAVTMNDGVGLCVEVNPDRIQKRIETGYLERSTDDLDEALIWVRQAQNAGKPTSIGLLGNAAEVLPELRERGVVPDVVTDQTSAHDLKYGYCPEGASVEEWFRLREEDSDDLRRRARESIEKHVRTMLAWKDQGSVVFEYGNNIRAQAREAGLEEAMSIPIFTEAYIRPLFCEGKGPFRWVALTGDSGDIEFIDRLLLEEFSDNELIGDWIPLAQQHLKHQGLPARIAWLGHGERSRLADRVNRAVRSGDLSGPVVFTRDHLDAGGVCQPLRETENMKDGTDAVADWPLLNALLNSGSGADLVAIHGGGGGYAGYYKSAGVTVVADGSESASERLNRVFDGDTGIGVLRYADAGYEQAQATARQTGIRSVRPEDDWDPNRV